MSDDRSTLRAIAWQEIFPGLKLVSALRMAFNFRILVLAALAIVGTVAGWRALGALFAETESPALSLQIDADSVWPWDYPLVRPSVERPAWPAGEVLSLPPADREGWPRDGAVATPPTRYLTTLEGWRLYSPLLWAWSEITRPFVAMYQAPTFTHFVYALSCAMWSLAVWSFFGGAITRQVAIQFARQENVGLGPLINFARSRWSAYFVAPLFPILGTFLAAGLMALAGLLMRFGPTLAVVGLFWFVVLLGGFMAAFLLIGLFFGWPLMWGAISAEGTDSFGALSHSYSYTYQRPLHYLIYALFAALLGVLGWFLVAVFADWTVHMAYWGVSWGSGMGLLEQTTQPEELTGLGATAGARLIHFWNGCVRMLALAFVFGYFWSASTVIYFLLRRLVDATELDEVYLPESGERHGLPPLKTGPDGVPAVTDETLLAGDDADQDQDQNSVKTPV